ncbi:MAG: right-handed parallel beta-helix repeat-containing protein, partial [Verrucomicrobiota bacterium]
MRSLFSSILLLLFGLQNLAVSAVKPVSNVEDLRAILATAGEGEVIELAAGEYQLTESLVVRGGVSLRGAGAGKTIIRPAPTWVPSTQSLPDPEVKIKGLDSSAYLIRLEDKAENIAISHLTLEGPAVHGAIFGFGNQQVELHHLHIENVLYCGIRSLGWKQANIHDCEFVDAGGKWKRGGVPGVDGGICGGAIFVTWISDSEIWNNRISRTIEGKERSHFGIKGRQGKRCKIHHNTINVNFSIEFPFEGDQDMEIHHNVLHGVVSIPKYAGGKVPESGRTFHIHHNY